MTGYYSVESGLRDSNKVSLAIDRIYQRREILAILRSFMNLIHRPSAQDPVVREVRYNLFKGWNPIHRHSISELSDCLVKDSVPPRLNYVNISSNPDVCEPKKDMEFVRNGEYVITASAKQTQEDNPE